MVENPIPRRHRPFEDAPAVTPFWRTTEFRLFSRLAGLLILIGIGFFYYILTHSTPETPDEAHPQEYVEEAARTTPVTPEEIAQREQRLVTAFEGALADSKNGEDLRETPGYYKLLKVVGDYTPEEVTRKATRPLSYAAVMADPDGWRGEFVWARGVVAGLESVPLDAHVYGRGRVFRGVLTDGDATNGILFDLTDYPGDKPEIREGAYDVEGVFYRLAKYAVAHPTKEGEFKTAPWLVVRSIRPVESAFEHRKAFLATLGPWVIGAMAVVVVIVLIFALQKSSRRRGPPQPRANESIREMFQRRLREDGTPPPPHASP